jgi:hypothetical protein
MIMSSADSLQVAQRAPKALLPFDEDNEYADAEKNFQPKFPKFWMMVIVMFVDTCLQRTAGQGSSSQKTFWMNIAKGHSTTWKSVLKGDGAAILLQGATSLTVDACSWESLTHRHADNASPTKVIVFEIAGSPLVATGCYESVGGGYFVYEYELNLIGQYL